jgi:hypothetical protein
MWLKVLNELRPFFPLMPDHWIYQGEDIEMNDSEGKVGVVHPIFLMEGVRFTTNRRFKLSQAIQSHSSL